LSIPATLAIALNFLVDPFPKVAQAAALHLGLDFFCGRDGGISDGSTQTSTG
jgi:hypothetical protein